MTEQRPPIVPPPEPSEEQVLQWLLNDGYPLHVATANSVESPDETQICISLRRLKAVACQAADWSTCEAARAERDSAVRSAEWGADQELEAVIHWLITGPYGALIACHADRLIADLRAARRPAPKPPNLKERALARLAFLERVIAHVESAGLIPSITQDDSIREALEQLDG